MRVALYCRESSDDTGKAPDIRSQIERGRAWASENGHEIVEEYQDNGFSGGDWTRPGWLQSVKDSKRHYWLTLWVWNQDRIARDTEAFLWFYRNLKEAGARIWEDTSGEFIDMETLGGRVRHQTMAQASEIFRLVTSEKVKQAYRRKRAKNEPWGRPARPFDLARARELRAQGLGYRRIARELGGVSFQTVRRALARVTE